MGFWLRDFDDHPFINPGPQDMPPPHQLPPQGQQQQQPPPAPYQGHYHWAQPQLPLQQYNSHPELHGQKHPLCPDIPLPGAMGQSVYLPPHRYVHTGYPALPQCAPPGQNTRPEDIVDLQFSIPRNTATVRAKGTVVVFWCDIAFTNWLFCVCEIMGLNVNTAELGYKYNGQRVGDHPTQLLSDNDLCIAISMGQGMATRMITKTLCIMIYNLKPPTQVPTAARGKKQCADADEDDATHIYAAPQLSSWPFLLCYKATGEHIELNVFTLTLWARKMVTNEATLEEPPNILSFDRCPTKKPQASGSSLVAPIEIHNHISTMTPAAPLTDRGGQCTLNTLTSQALLSHPDDDTMYLTMAQALHELDDIMPGHNMVQYLAHFRNHGIYRLDSVNHVDITTPGPTIHMRPTAGPFRQNVIDTKLVNKDKLISEEIGAYIELVGVVQVFIVLLSILADLLSDSTSDCPLWVL
ncbi:hypothetical protein FIBSPDRAFT_956878 [Athelia psychrophila]|uniref:Uncharacterized protein n=1 Tax=Athelia psychrophila TaxID=1759441 RepID=A0A166GF57_9AGAM|nr:hypothetical protein FIBSPDRAFT_956878 [Fibularhizoctonia sp. CBS 109695]